MEKHNNWLESYIKTTVKVISDRIDTTVKLLSDRIYSTEENVQELSKAIRRFYIWLGSVGISLLLFFLSFGVAALRYVDSMNYSIQEHTKELTILKENSSKNVSITIDKEVLKKAVKEVLEDSNYK